MVHLRGRQEGASHDHSLANDSNGSRGAPRYDRTQAIRRPLLPSESLDKGRFNIVAEEASDGAKVTPPWSTDGLLSHTSTEPL